MKLHLELPTCRLWRLHGSRTTCARLRAKQTQSANVETGNRLRIIEIVPKLGPRWNTEISEVSFDKVSAAARITESPISNTRYGARGVTPERPGANNRDDETTTGFLGSRRIHTV